MTGMTLSLDQLRNRRDDQTAYGMIERSARESLTTIG
jgi:hypothetical protein